MYVLIFNRPVYIFVKLPLKWSKQSEAEPPELQVAGKATAALARAGGHARRQRHPRAAALQRVHGELRGGAALCEVWCSPMQEIFGGPSPSEKEAYFMTEIDMMVRNTVAGTPEETLICL